ncbi:menaquinol-cytochrome c reductase cytochrome b/c subunit [Insulibacter thermoxylanivorax]|uniref:Menaquinol-cytochrome c reductase cytochrome b/c subunit n=1 Tax=Insulibacter thermoxylanivorax TaxID=2749268 RepID=A0A916VE64_9BACL|nr:menaquinol-cytochrome c reductase cytochrome b/c subunit [Insulibacter thermoxylanivorax]GFR36907.1 menaquinol-cytochrome c reductase cytochrome b/c subunit [Insulibacter thermoxylanivorax]
MAQDRKDTEKVVYVGDSRVRRVQRTNIPKDYSAYPGKTEAFVPNFLLKEWMVGAVVLVGFMILVMTEPPPLGYPADPTNTAFIPIPDWYFLFLYQFLKYDYVSQSFVMFGAVLVPGIAFGALLLAPWLDRGKERRWYKRPVASGVMLLTLASMIYLTYVAWTDYERTLEEQGITPEHIERARLIADGEIEGGAPRAAEEPTPLVAVDEAGYEIYQNSTCLNCHGTDLMGSSFAPSLRGIGDKYTADEIHDIIINGKGIMAGQLQDNLNKGLTEDDLQVLADWLAKQQTQEE